MLHDLGIEFAPGNEATAALAEQHFARYLARGGTAGRVVPDADGARFTGMMCVHGREPRLRGRMGPFGAPRPVGAPMDCTAPGEH